MELNEETGQFEWPEQSTTDAFEESKAIAEQYLALLIQLKQYKETN
ncbi:MULTISPECIES: hypothetical protein [Pseudomonas]|nr:MULTISPECIES: hypothetical protein [Pseudomonas]MBJ2242501.1 hypothetical protein [Pseudomonas sp. MF6768]NWF13515.1 hypothetical protein [Pseudomonas reactans]